MLGEVGVERERQRPRRPSKLDPYMAFITETLERFPTLTGARLFDMVNARVYLRHVFTALPKAQSLAEIEALLPTRLDTAALAPDSLQESFLAARQ